MQFQNNVSAHEISSLFFYGAILTIKRHLLGILNSKQPCHTVDNLMRSLSSGDPRTTHLDGYAKSL